MARDDEPYFVFVVPMFAIKLRQHSLEPRCFPTNINYVSCDITANGFQSIDLPGIRAKNLLRGRVDSERMDRYPSLVVYATGFKARSNSFFIS